MEESNHKIGDWAGLVDDFWRSRGYPSKVTLWGPRINVYINAEALECSHKEAVNLQILFEAECQTGGWRFYKGPNPHRLQDYDDPLDACQQAYEALVAKTHPVK
jgi:hypothetical protein